MILTDPSDEAALQSWLQMLARQGRRQEALKCYEEMKAFMEVQGFPLSEELEQGIDSIKNQENINRRSVTKSMSTLLGSFLLPSYQSPGLMYIGKLLQSEERLSICSTNIPILWRLYFDGHLAEIQRPLLSEHLPQLASLIHQPNFQKRAASLASKAFQLAALIEKHHQNWGNALFYAQQGEQYGELAEDANLQVSALIQQANIYFDLCQIQRELQTYQKASYLYQEEMKRKYEVSPLLLGRVYIGLAKAYGKLSNHSQQALKFLGKAHETYPSHAEADSAFSYSCHTRFTLSNHTGLTYLNIEQPERALSIFEQIPEPPSLVPRRLEWLIRLSMAYFALGDLEQTSKYVCLAATSAKTLGSELRYNEAYNIYEQMQYRWSQEPRVKTLAEYFR